jgi:CubicO group peptidase (beta-lactamase class C family)
MLDPYDASGRKIRRMYGPSRVAFGHPGAGGVHAFADPENGLAFAYVMNQMELGVFPNRKSLAIVAAIYGER